MPKLTSLRLHLAAGLLASLAIAVPALSPASAGAATSQFSMIQDGPQTLSNPDGTFQRFRLLGASAVRVVVPWFNITRSPFSHKRPSHFNAADPSAYPGKNWAPYDSIVRAAQKYGITVDMVVSGGSPAWADGPGVPRNGVQEGFAWKPSAKQYGLFFTAVAKRYSGTFKTGGSDLPRVSFWTIYNEPNFGQDLGPQSINGTRSVAPGMYRGILNAGWRALHATGHGHDRILIGEFAARGNSFHRPTRHLPQGLPGNYGQTKPLDFIKTLYCVDSRYRLLRGGAARAVGCPASAGASHRFRSQNPALFGASGVGDHPYQNMASPVSRGDGGGDPAFAIFPDLGRLGAELDHVNRIYGSRTHYAIYNDEFSYITSPPKPRGTAISESLASLYINWAEYLSYKTPRIKSYMQYLLQDPAPNGARRYNQFASGLLTFKGRQKADYSAFRLPLFMPVTTGSRHRNLQVWGGVRPEHFVRGQTVNIQFASGSSSNFKTLKSLNVTNSTGYFDIHMRFPGRGTVRLSWTYPQVDSLLPSSALGVTVFSRHVTLKLH